MNINRHNYESFFLLYADNELSATERKEVAEFVQQNPDLGRELELLQQSVFRPDSGVVFAGKEDLMRTETPLTGIHAGNYESFFLSYADDELTAEEKKSVEGFLDLHPQYQGELELLHAARMSPDMSVVYEDKQDLYRREEKDKIVPFPWWRLAAAAMVIVLLGFWWLNRPKAVIAPTLAHQGAPVPATAQPVTAPQTPAPAIAGTTTKVKPVPATGVQPDNATATTADAVKSNRHLHKNDDHLASNHVKQAQPPVQQLTNNLPAPPKTVHDDELLATTSDPNEKPGPLPERPRNAIDIKTVKAPGKAGLSNRLIAAAQPEEDNAVAQFASYNNNPNNDQIDVLTTSVNKKTALRGLLRRASRIIAKKTSTDDGSDDDKHILIGSFAIAVK